MISFGAKSQEVVLSPSRCLHMSLFVPAAAVCTVAVGKQQPPPNPVVATIKILLAMAIVPPKRRPGEKSALNVEIALKSTV